MLVGTDTTAWAATIRDSTGQAEKTEGREETNGAGNFHHDDLGMVFGGKPVLL